MKNDLENKLQQLTPRKIPAEWRNEILRTAKSAQSEAIPPVAAKNFGAWIDEIVVGLRLPRLAWACIGTAWLVIGGLGLANRAITRELALQVALPASETMRALQQEKLILMAELNEQPKPAIANKPAEPLSGPRSQRRPEELFA